MFGGKRRTRAPHGTPVCGLRITCGGLCRLHEVALRSATDAGNVIHAHVLEHLRVERLAQLLHIVELRVVLNGRQGHGAGIALWHLKRYVGGVKIARVIA